MRFVPQCARPIVVIELHELGDIVCAYCGLLLISRAFSLLPFSDDVLKLEGARISRWILRVAVNHNKFVMDMDRGRPAFLFLHRRISWHFADRHVIA